LYHSSFNYITVNTDFNSREINLAPNVNDEEPATKASYLDYFAERFNYPGLQNELSDVYNLLDFVKKFQIKKNQICARDKPEKCVVITFPKMRPNPDDPVKHAQFCYHAMIKFSNWSKANIDEIKTIETAAFRWRNFLLIAPQSVIDQIKFQTDLVKELTLARRSVDEDAQTIPITRDDWMVLADISPGSDDLDEIDDIPIDTNHDWFAHALKYSHEELQKMPTWVNDQKALENDSNSDQIISMVNVETLNVMQRFAFNLVKHFHDTNKQLLCIINGTAGTGKSYLINSLVQIYNEKHLRCAPTAKAAFIIRGETLHSTVFLPVSKNQTTLDDLSGDRLSLIQDKFKNIKLVIIDEYSMVSQVMLGQTDKRLRQATGKINLYFGGISIILIGDNGQLPPVAGNVLYKFPPKTNLALHGFNCYKQFKLAIRLQVSQRQQNLNNDQNQEHFIKFLGRLREGLLDDTQTLIDWQFILKNRVTPINILQFANVIRLYPDNASCHKLNSDKLIGLQSAITKITALNSPQRVKNLSEEHFSGLFNFIYLCNGARLTLTANLWTKKGLVNGANCYVRDIIYLPNAKNNLPHAILLELENYQGPKFFPLIDTRVDWIPIPALNVYNRNVGGSRTQYPLRLAYALTIHKSQGQTMDKVVIDLGKCEKTLGMSYVALSRVKNFSDFLIEPFPLDRFLKIKQSSALNERTTEENRINTIISQTLNQFDFLMNISRD
jgi:ATP-dependent DNA helicase PIF1